MSNFKRYHTEILEKSRKRICNGDVFVVKIKDHKLYFYGKVIETKANFNDILECILIFLYKTPTTEITIPKTLDKNDIMTVLLIDNYGWRCGHFKTVCNIPIEEEKNVDYGFLSSHHGGWINKEDVHKYKHNHEINYLDDGRIISNAYVDAYNNVLDHKPKIINYYLAGFYSSVSAEISNYIYMNPDVKRKYGLE